VPTPDPTSATTAASAEAGSTAGRTRAALLVELIAARDELRRNATAFAELHAERVSLALAVAERTDQLRDANEELRTASQAKTEFLANVSHELRTPLTAILGFSEVLVTGLDGPLNPRQHEDASTILSSSRRLVELIDDLIDISRIEANRVELRTQPVDVAAVLSTVADEVRPLAGQKGIGLTLEDGPAGLEVEADSIRIHSIVLHIVSNAVKFTPTGGTVRICVATEPASAGHARPMVRIDVCDTGIGIAAEDQDRIFEKFQRLGGAEHQGTGLGLAIARELANLHGGSLTVESTLGLGSTFSLRIPRAGGSVAPA
jgi:signal transduction histidine kinase